MTIITYTDFMLSMSVTSHSVGCSGVDSRKLAATGAAYMQGFVVGHVTRNQRSDLTKNLFLRSFLHILLTILTWHYKFAGAPRPFFYIEIKNIEE